MPHRVGGIRTSSAFSPRVASPLSGLAASASAGNLTLNNSNAHDLPQVPHTAGVTNNFWPINNTQGMGRTMALQPSILRSLPSSPVMGSMNPPAINIRSSTFDLPLENQQPMNDMLSLDQEGNTFMRQEMQHSLGLGRHQQPTSPMQQDSVILSSLLQTTGYRQEGGADLVTEPPRAMQLSPREIHSPAASIHSSRSAPTTYNTPLQSQTTTPHSHSIHQISPHNQNLHINMFPDHIQDARSPDSAARMGGHSPLHGHSLPQDDRSLHHQVDLSHHLVTSNLPSRTVMEEADIMGMEVDRLPAHPSQTQQDTYFQEGQNDLTPQIQATEAQMGLRVETRPSGSAPLTGMDGQDQTRVMQQLYEESLRKLQEEQWTKMKRDQQAEDSRLWNSAPVRYKIPCVNHQDSN